MGVMPHLDVRPQDWCILTDLLGRHLPEGTVVWAFGSRIQGTARPTSDLDLVAFVPDAQGVSRLREDLEESNLPFAVDLHVWKDLPSEFQAVIQAHHVELPVVASANRGEDAE